MVLDDIEEDLGDETSRLMPGVDESTILMKKKNKRGVSFNLREEYPHSETTEEDSGLKHIFVCRIYLILLWQGMFCAFILVLISVNKEVNEKLTRNLELF